MTTEIEHKVKCEAPRCYFSKDGHCEFWVEAMNTPGVFKPIFEDDSAGPKVIDSFREPCIDRDYAKQDNCVQYHIPHEDGWLKCAGCREDCEFVDTDDSIGNTLEWMKKNR